MLACLGFRDNFSLTLSNRGTNNCRAAITEINTCFSETIAFSFFPLVARVAVRLIMICGHVVTGHHYAATVDIHIAFAAESSVTSLRRSFDARLP